MFDIGHHAPVPEPMAHLATVSVGTLASVVDGAGQDLLAASLPSLAIRLGEGRTVTAYVKLSRKPESQVSVSFSSSGLLELDIYDPSSLPYGGSVRPFYRPPVLVFDSTNWNVPQSFSMQSIEDGIADGLRTLPVRMTISMKGAVTITKPIWVRSIDSGTVSTSGSQPFKSSGTTDRIFDAGVDKNIDRLSDSTALASYDGANGTARFRVSSRKLSIRNLDIEIDYTISPQNKVVVRRVRGYSPRDLSLDLGYISPDTYRGASGLSGTMTLRQPQRGLAETFFVTSAAKNSCDVNQYAGTWYEQGSAKTKVSARLRNARYSYTPQPNGTLSVEYAGNYGSTSGVVQRAIGVATPVRDLYSYSTNTQFNVVYSRWSAPRPPSSDYRIVDFAPDYSWAIASDSAGRNGVILSREKIIDEAAYKSLLDRAQWLGVDTASFVRTMQSALP